MKSIRVLIVDDSAIVREILEKGLSRDPDIEVVGKAPDVYVARDKIVFLKPDVLTLDVEMPGMDGIEFLRRLMPQYPIPVVMVSALTEQGARATIQALEHGAVDFVPKPSARGGSSLYSMMDELIEKIKIASGTDVSHWKSLLPYKSRSVVKENRILENSTDKLIAVGASTGGTVALTKIIEALPHDIPGIVVVQHMPPVFTKMFAEKLNETTRVSVKEAQDGDRILQGQVLIAPGGYHMEVLRSGGIYLVKCFKGEKVNGHTPSVDVLFDSVARCGGPNAIGVQLTGMGRDGAEGMLKMRKAGSRTMAQDEASSVVFGMPREAWENGGAERLVSLEKIPDMVLKYLEEIQSKVK